MAQYHFQGAHIHGGDFRAISGDFYLNQGSGIQALSQAISHGAMHDSAERDPPPRCHPGTREKATEDIVRWIDESNPSSNVLWVNGRAGVGKSALMQKIAELGLIYFGGCFFFRRGTPGRNVKDHLFSTLAYQLVTNVHGMLELVDQAMIRDFSLPKRSAAVQLNRLIIEPIRLLPIPPRPVIIIIDGLDECEDFNSQRDILRLIGQVTLDPNITIWFIIASRPEHQICEMFNKEPLLSKTRRLILDDEDYDTAADIERYLREEFEGIHSCNRDIMTGVENPWPSEDNLKELVWRASGQFIYAATVIKFIGSDMDFHTPQEKLEIILKRGPMQASVFSELDRLYTQILSLYPDPEVLIHTLGVTLALENLSSHSYRPAPLNSPALITVITGFGEGRVHRVLRALSSTTEIRIEPVFDDYDDDEPNGTPIQWVKLSHRSFHDFLTDRARSGPYFIDMEIFNGQEVLLRILELATISIKELKENRSLLPPINPNIWNQFYFVLHKGLPQITWSSSSLKMGLCLALNNLRTVLFNDQPLLSGMFSKPFCAALIPTLECVVTVSYPIRNSRFFNLPKKDDPLQLHQFFTGVQNLLDECYRQTMTGFINGEISILMPLITVETLPFPKPKSLMEIEAITNIPDQQRLRRFVKEHSFLILPQHTSIFNGYLLEYSITCWLCDFIFDPNRSQSLYSASLVTRECQRAIEVFIAENDNSGYSPKVFFVPDEPKISNASCLLEHAKNGSDSNAVLLFLQYLSKIHWHDIYTRGWEGRNLTDSITQWACTTLNSLSLEPGPLRDMMQNVLTAILSCGMLPVLGQQISRATELGIFEDQNCLRCWRDDFPEILRSTSSALRILPLCTGQSSIQALCTRIVESHLLGMVQCIDYIILQHTCRDGFTQGYSEIDPFLEPGFFYCSDVLRCNWGFAFTHASTSSKCILFAIRTLVQFNYFAQEGRLPIDMQWIVSEVVDWLKNQTVDPKPQYELIAWMKDANKKIEKKIAAQRQIEYDEELQRSAEWASVIQRCQAM